MCCLVCVVFARAPFVVFGRCVFVVRVMVAVARCCAQLFVVANWCVVVVLVVAAQCVLRDVARCAVRRCVVASSWRPTRRRAWLRALVVCWVIAYLCVCVCFYCPKQIKEAPKFNVSVL